MMAKPKKSMMTAKPMKAIKAATKAAMISKASPKKKPEKRPKAMKKAMMTAKPMKAIKAATKTAMISKASQQKKAKKAAKGDESGYESGDNTSRKGGDDGGDFLEDMANEVYFGRRIQQRNDWAMVRLAKRHRK